jgi:hypothetical protein
MGQRPAGGCARLGGCVLPAPMPASKIRVIRDRKGGLAGAASNRVEALRQLYRVAESLERNPAEDVG